MKEKINKFLLKAKEVWLVIDAKVRELIPNDRLRKVLYITISSFVGLFVFLILLGILLSPFRRNGEAGFSILKPRIDSQLNREIVLTETEKELQKLESEIRNLKFPQSELTIPDILFKIVL